MATSRFLRHCSTSAGLGISLALGAAVAGQAPVPDRALSFKGQQIASDFGVGYAVATGDVNGDKRNRHRGDQRARISSGSRLRGFRSRSS